MSLGQATEAGCEVRMKDNELTLFDRSVDLIVRTTRSKNRLYKVALQADTIQCLLMTVPTESATWHTRLDHINTETMKTMINKELVSGIPRITIGKEFCDSCLLGKQTRQPFPQSTLHRATQPLERVHGYLCGPITLPRLEGNIMCSC